MNNIYIKIYQMGIVGRVPLCITYTMRVVTGVAGSVFTYDMFFVNSLLKVVAATDDHIPVMTLIAKLISLV